MSGRFHANPETGKVSACNATVRACPHGEALHGSSREEAAFAYESHLRNDSSLSPFANFKKMKTKSRAGEVSEERVSRWESLLHRTGDFLERRGVMTAVAGGLVVTAAVGGGLAAYHATQTYAPVEATVVSSSHTPRVEAGTTGIDVEWTTKAEVQVEGGEVKDVTFLGKKNFQEGENLTLYKSDAGLSPTKPNSAEQYVLDSTAGILAGTLVGGSVAVATLLVPQSKGRRLSSLSRQVEYSTSV